MVAAILSKVAVSALARRTKSDDTEFRMDPNDKELNRLIKKLKREVTNMRIPMKKSSIQFEKWVHHNFDVEGAELSEGIWPDFKLGGRRIKGHKDKASVFEGIDYSAKLLQDTRNMRLRGTRVFHTANQAGVRISAKSKQGKDYAVFHNFGVPSRNLPARRMIPTRREIMPDVIRVFEQHLQHVANKYGRI